MTQTRIAVANQKGGVGKTTTAVALAAESHDSGIRTLLVDLDPQGTASAIWGWDPAQARDGDLYSQMHTLIKGQPINRADGVYLAAGREALLAGSIDLAALEMELQGAMHREHILADLLDQMSRPYDRVILDCPPSFGLLTINALTAATHVVIPCIPDYVSVQGLGRLWDTIQLVRVRKLNPALEVAGVLLTQVRAQTLHHRDYAQDVEAFCRAHDLRFLGSVPNTIKVADASGGGLAVTRYMEANGAREAYKAIAERLWEVC